MKKNLLIDYDEPAQEIRFYEVSPDGKQSLAIKVPLSLYQEKGFEEAERVMGETIFTFFDRWADIKMGLRDYVGEAHQSLASRRSEIGKLAESGNAEAQYQFAIDCFTTGAREHSSDQIERADLWLRKAAANGSIDAAEYLAKHWERDKASALRGM